MKFNIIFQEFSKGKKGLTLNYSAYLLVELMKFYDAKKCRQNRIEST